ATTLAALMEATMRRQPQAPALTYGTRTLSYGELDTLTGSLAAHLRANGVGNEDIVAVALPRSLELVIALIAVLRAGAAYLPLDLQHPPERIARILASAQARCVLARSEDAG